MSQKVKNRKIKIEKKLKKTKKSCFSVARILVAAILPGRRGGVRVYYANKCGPSDHAINCEYPTILTPS